MVRIRKLAAIDWPEVEQNVLEAAAGHIVAAARARSGAQPGSIIQESPRQGMCRVRLTNAELIVAERGETGHPPRPFFCPSGADRQDMRDAIIRHLEQALS